MINKSGVIYVGAKIPDEDMQVLKETLAKVQMYADAQDVAGV